MKLKRKKRSKRKKRIKRSKRNKRNMNIFMIEENKKSKIMLKKLSLNQ